MTDFILKKFIKDYKNVSSAAVREKYGTVSSVVGIIVNIIISTVKLVLGILTFSVALMADALNNFSDAGSSIVTLISFKLSGKPADRDHPFGHARIEYIASMIVSFLILIVGFEMFSGSLNAIFGKDDGKTVSFSTVSIIIVGISVLFKLWLGFFYRKVGNKINSTVIKASSTDCFMDTLSTLAVLASAIVVKFTGFVIFDAIVGMGVSILIFVAGIRILNETKNSILGEAPTAEILEKILAIVGKYDDVVGTHDILLHNYGPNKYIASFHAEVDGTKDIYMLHDTIDNLEKEIASQLDIICTIHLDPIVTDDKTVNELREFSCCVINDVLGDDVTMHDFRAVIGETHTNLIFDIVLPYESKYTPDEAMKIVSDEVLSRRDKHYCVITVDRG